MNKAFAILFAAAGVCAAVETQVWEHSAASDFEKATLKKVALRNDGRLSLAPVLEEIYDASIPYLWAVVEDSRGKIYAAGGGPDAGAKVFEIDTAAASGQRAKTLATIEGLQVQALALDRQNRLYAATSPDGKVFRFIDGKTEVFYDPKAKYIWAMTFSSQGDLFVATGDKGEVHKVSSTGQGSVFYRTEQTHARSLALDSKGNLIVGTEPGGFIVSVTPSAEGFILYQSGKREITTLAAHKDGTIWAAAVGVKPAGGPPAPVGPAQGPTPAAAANATGGSVRSAPIPAPPPIPSMTPGISGGSEIYRIEADGFTRQMWASGTEFVYSIAFDSNGRAVLGTGNKGCLHTVESELLSVLLPCASPTQLTSLFAGSKGRVWAASGNTGRLFRLGPEVEKQGTIESEPLDAGFFAYWGRARSEGERLAGNVRIETRSGNHDAPPNGWSAYQELAAERIVSPAARFLQYRVTLQAPPQGSAPEVSLLELAHVQKNVAPVVEMVVPTPANYKFPSQSLSLTPSTNITLPGLSRTRHTPAITPTVESTALIMSYGKGFTGVRWLASDPNGDALSAKVEIRGVGERAWKLLKENVRDKGLGWDSTSFPDGDYVVRVTVSDSPDNTPQTALSASLESDPFVIDNTPPEIAALTASRSGGRIQASWRAIDARNALARAEYSLNGSDWTVVEPTTRMLDSRQHEFTLAVEAPPGEATFAVRVEDAHDNQAIAKTVVR